MYKVYLLWGVERVLGETILVEVVLGVFDKRADAEAEGRRIANVIEARPRITENIVNVPAPKYPPTWELINDEWCVA